MDRLGTQDLPVDREMAVDRVDLGHQEAPGRRDLRACPDHRGRSLTSSRSSTRFSSPREERKDPLQILSPTCKHRLDQLDHEDPQVSVDLLDHKDLWDPRESQETMDQLDQLVWLDLEV